MRTEEDRILLSDWFYQPKWELSYSLYTTYAMHHIYSTEYLRDIWAISNTGSQLLEQTKPKRRVFWGKINTANCTLLKLAVCTQNCGISVLGCKQPISLFVTLSSLFARRKDCFPESIFEKRLKRSETAAQGLLQRQTTCTWCYLIISLTQ